MRGTIVAVGMRHTLMGLCVGALLAATCRPAHALDGDIVKGTIGGAMLGAEVVMLGESAFRLRPGWLYLVGGGAGAAAGAYLGYKICDDSSNKPPSFLLAGGIALVIPTIMGVLTATQYAPPDSYRQEPRSADDSAAAEPSLELPSLGLAQAFSPQELAQFRVDQVTELHLSLLRGVF